VDDINLLGDSISTTKENTETLLEKNRDIYLQVNAEESTYMNASSSEPRTEA
jgi:hypothetical protein